MGAVLHLRILAPLVLLAGLLAACGNGSSSSSADDSTIVGSSGGFEIRPVYARYAPGISLGPQVPAAVLDEMKQQSCPMKPRIVQQMLMECDDANTVYLLRNPIVTGDVSSATAKQIGHKDIWYVEVELDGAGASALQPVIQNDIGTELAFSYGGKVVTSLVVDSSLHAEHFGLTGDLDKAQATALAKGLTG
jgi:preprotein translocase subunit SecD